MLRAAQFLWSVFYFCRRKKKERIFALFSQPVGECKLWVYGGLETSV